MLWRLGSLLRLHRWLTERRLLLGLLLLLLLMLRLLLLKLTMVVLL